MTKRTRPAVLGGSWYARDPERLRAEVHRYLEGADPRQRPEGRPVLAVVPHAGYAYSGPTAGRLYGLLAGLSYDRVFVLSPSHRAPLPRVGLPEADAFATPLGPVPVDREVVDRLAGHAEYGYDGAAHAGEHAVEIQLPFLQVVFGERLRLVPLLVPMLPAPERRRAAAALAPWCDGRSLLVVSTDFTHYGADYGFVPFRDRIPERLADLDGGAVERILARDPAGLVAYGERTGITMCGLAAAALALEAPLPGGAGRLVDYRRSADPTGDYGLSVSYAAILLTATSPAGAGAETVGTARADARGDATTRAGADIGPEPGLTADERRLLLDLARAVVEATARGDRPPDPLRWCAREDRTITPRLERHAGAFVTLERGGRLRGCIGHIEPICSLLQSVADNAAAAASRDPRFPPVGPDELDDLELEISVLTPLRPVAGPADIEIGRHGILLQKGPARSVFLPQVAVEQGWDLPTTLTHLALKAGLPADGWRRGARFEVFEAEIVHEPGKAEP